MPSQNIVVDEWLIHDLSGENGRKAQGQAYRFLSKLKDKCDRLVVLRGSVWVKKAYALMKSLDPDVQRLSRFLHLSILRDLKKCQYLEKCEVHALPEDVAAKVPRKDIYLVETCCSAATAAFVTTDRTLFDCLQAACHINVRLRDEFLEEYIELSVT